MGATTIGPHRFEEGELGCCRCKATRGAAELDAKGEPTRHGLPYARFPECLPDGEKPANTGVLRRVPGMVLRAIRLCM